MRVIPLGTSCYHPLCLKHTFLFYTDLGPAPLELEARPKAQIAVSQSKAKEFLSVFHRFKRNVWDRSRPDVQQWIQQFMYMGYDEARLETDLSYWMDQARSNDQGWQHHHDENAPMSQQDPSSYRHGANVNYDYY
ncbi:augurin-B-like [Sinocyclocheilus anshuiensis]|uniref:augurin-B-like n=1 Tax=Sinocyclocheilus anshuiensis TaxID=1608454 RepID=UPI0007B9369F|nr:PREDICTED: augurin-B-like [Sinocyclocheilus anshuiensis]